MKRRIDCVRAADGLRELIIKRPDLPVLFVSAGRGICESVEAELGEFLDADPPEYLPHPVYLSRRQFADDLRLYWEEAGEWYVEDLVKLALENYEPYWTNCIIARVE